MTHIQNLDDPSDPMKEKGILDHPLVAALTDPTPVTIIK